MLAENVEDEDAQHHALRHPLARERSTPAPGNGLVVTTFVFRVRNLPAALYKALGGFATNGVNMTKLESYMIEGNFFATMFYADVEGHPDDPPLALALEELEVLLAAGSLQILGVYPAQRVPLDLQGREGLMIRRGHARRCRRHRARARAGLARELSAI